MDIPSFPFKVLALAPFQSQTSDPWTSGPLQVHSANLDPILDQVGVTLDLPLPKDLCPAGRLNLRFKEVKDFHPEGLLNIDPYLKNILEARRFIQEAKGLSPEEIYSRLRAWPDFPLQIQWEPGEKKPISPSPSPVDKILQMVAFSDDGSKPQGYGQPFIAQIDSFLGEILAHIYSQEAFRDLESAWRGLKFLLKQGPFDGELSLNIVPVSPSTLEETLDRQLPHLVQDLPSLILIDLPLDQSPRSLAALEKISQFSETLLAPAIGWIRPQFFSLETWQDLPKLPFLPHHLDGPPLAKWRAFKKSSPPRWVALACNRFRVRPPYGKDLSPGEVWFKESQGLWASPVWGVGGLVVQSLIKTGWPTRFTEWKNIRLEDLALDRTAEEKNIPTESMLSEERIDQFIRAGFIPLVSIPNQDIAFSPGEPTVAGGSLAYQLLLSRITRFLFWCKDHFPRELDPAGVEEGLKTAFNLLWERSGHPAPKSLEISVTQAGPEEALMVKVSLQPSRRVLFSEEKIDLEFRW